MLPATERILLGPGPSLIAPRVTRAMAAPMLSHLDPQFLALMDDTRTRLTRVFQTPEGSFAFPVSGTGTSAMEVSVANLVEPGHARAVDRHGLLWRSPREYVPALWSRGPPPGWRMRSRVRSGGRRPCAAGVVRRHCHRRARRDVDRRPQPRESVLNPVKEVARAAHTGGALVIVDAVTSLGAMPLDVAGWDLDVVYSCSQKGLGAPSGVAPLVFTPRALAKRVPCRSFASISRCSKLLVRRKYHHTMCASLIYSLREALMMVEEGGLSARWARHERHHLAFATGLAGLGLSLLPPPGERLWTLNAVRVPEGTDDAAVRQFLLQRFNMEIGAGLGPLAGKIWRIGLMGSSSTEALVTLCLSALSLALRS